MELPLLDARDQRILGSLLEKQVTVPASYPLTLNSLRLACNQSSSREPVVDYSESEVDETLRELKKRGLVRFVVVQGQRVIKYHQLLDEVLGLEPAERALLTVLLLRGAQAPGELRTRTERLHPFADRAEVQRTLQAMRECDPPLVIQLALRPREQDRRWVHLLGPVDSGAVAVAAPQTDRDAVLAGGAEARDASVRQTYGIVAEEYGIRFSDELAHKPFDTWLLDRIVELSAGPVADVGTGPGQVAAYLAEVGAEVVGFDVSEGMVAEAQVRHPEVTFEVVDLRRLLRPRAAAGWGAITAWYALVHFAESELPEVLRGLGATLTPGGWLAFAVHVGPDTRHVTDWFGHAVEVDFVLHEPGVVRAAVASAGLEIVEWYVRGPYSQVEVETERLYVLARRPAPTPR